MTPRAVFQRYEQIRRRLPSSHRIPACPSKPPEHVPDLDALSGHFDVFVFDAFGVLNVGEQAIHGAVQRFEALQSMGKRLYILTNSASYEKDSLIAKFRRLGFNVDAENIISSREVMIHNLSTSGIFSDSAIESLGVINVCNLADFPANLRYESISGKGDYRQTVAENERFQQADGYIFLSAAHWNADAQAELLVHLKRNPKPVYVGNPDLVAPREGCFSLEPGYYAHELLDQTECPVEFFGKPFQNTFSYAIAKIKEKNALQSLDRILMLGDTLHTDILGALASGIKTALVTDHGSYAGQDVSTYISESEIVPDYILPSI
ncbi:HAD-IIA family hydrolase [Marinobacter salinisoli]|uniref:HAD-IIA family hydrolase n=1 Tax=Marinobacter salinisoli TaxID=2769486 RepID=A0ABX7MUB6_9GAMM|nr:HAD-IIA family hydrolase [Marinobacter salinisoli]QSP95087.1 HAD-IIA family hydrolase [Marinobacter salinisoli]